RYSLLRGGLRVRPARGEASAPARGQWRGDSRAAGRRKPFGLARRVRAPLAERRGRLPLEDGLAPDRRRPAAQALGGHAAPRSAHQDARGLRRGRQPRPAPGGRCPGAAHVDPRCRRRGLLGPTSEKAIERSCDRNWGVGSDGILLLVASQRAEFGLRIFNPDGSEAEKSGNGLRIFAKYLWDHGRTKKTTFTVDTKGGVVECQCRVEGGRMGFVTVEMGRATFRAPEIPMNGPDRDVVSVPLQLGDGTSLSVTAVSVGNPHCVTFVERLDEGERRRLGPLIERH